jgi:hypothetical protein
MVEGVLRHDTEMDVEKQYLDTHGQSEVGFVFSYLLGFSLLPRLKNLKKNGCGIAKMKRIENALFGLTSPLPFLSRRGTPSLFERVVCSEQQSVLRGKEVPSAM